MPYPEHDRVFRNSAPIILQQIITTPIIVHHIIIRQAGARKTLPLVPDASHIKTSQKRDVEESLQRREHNATKDKSQNHGPKDYKVTLRRVVRRQDKATHSELRPDDCDMVVMHRETFDTLVRAKHQESTDSDRVAGNQQKAKTPGLIEQPPKRAIHHEVKVTVKPLKSAMHVRKPEREHSKQREATPAIERHVKFQSSEHGTVGTKRSMKKNTVEEQTGS
ncbi:hypothetical protein MMC27_007543 [Xylographa pallens]|nr:hypothetical protein [Xylographa pallens]